MTADRVKDLFDLPENVHKIGFVEELARAVQQPKITAENYVVTPGLVASFDRALNLVGSAVRDGRSRAAFLQGSFGSGKSHFMALLSLLLDGEEHAWRIPELHSLREKYEWSGKAKLLQLRFHMIGHSGTLESAIFSRYLDVVRKVHPTAPVPGVFADERLFEDARRMLDELGEDKFFAPMNAGKKSDDAWGAIGQVDLWTGARFEVASTSTNPKEREELFNALVSTRFAAFTEESRRFVGLDEGLAILGRHAKSLGYAGVVLFLDELILWLASRAADHGWFHNEVQKIVKLVESQEAQRDVPFISFIARQRDLAEMVGRDHEGFQNALVRDSLKWSEGRFDTIHLEDRNLPAIAERRILRSKDENAKKSLDEAFRAMRTKLGDAAWQLLLGDLDEKEFRRLYPFSPVLMDSLVALSNSLQRERTAIRLLTELLVEHVEDLLVGDVVGVGDLFDVIAGGDDSTDGIMRARFDSAKQLYSFQFLPVIQQTHGTNTPDRCQRLRSAHLARIGCSNCPERQCRTDNRLVKTMLIAALVPERPAFKDLTASKLVQLNHGSLRAPIPGMEVNLAAQKLRNWASSGTIAQLHVGTQSDPTVRLQLEGVDTGPIVESARQYDTAGARQKVLRDIVMEALGIEGVQEAGKDHTVKGWRGTDRKGHVRFGNVRRMSAEQLLCPEGDDWRLIIDYPFDEDAFGPHDDEKAIETFLQSHTHGTWTIVWLPTFFSKDIQRVLGDLVVLEHILSDGPTTRQYVSHLSVENQSRAAIDLGNLRTQKQKRIRDVLEQAYGLATPRESDLDFSNAVEKHVIVLKPGVTIRPQLAAALNDALERYAEELISARYRLHPKFPRKLTKNAIEELVARFGEMVDSEDKSIPVDRERAELLRGFLMELGLARVFEDKATLRDDEILHRLETTRSKKAIERPEVGQVRSWIDESGARGLQPDALDLLVRCYARWTARTFVEGERGYEPKAGHVIPPYIALERPDLPTNSTWAAAIKTAGEFGVTFSGRSVHADSLKRFEGLVVDYFKPKQVAAARLPVILEQRSGRLGLPTDTDRLTTARSAASLCAQLVGQNAKGIVEVLAAYEPKTSGRAVGASLAGAEEAVRVVDDELSWGYLDQLRTRDDVAGASELLEKLAQLFRQDEIQERLGTSFRELAKKALALLQPAVAAPTVPGTEVRSLPATARGRAEVKAALSKLLRDAEAVLDAAGDEVELSGSLRVTWRKKP